MSEAHGASWLQLSLELGERDADTLEAVLLELGAMAVTLEDNADQPILEPPPGATPLWHRTRVTGLFAGNANPETLGEQLRRYLGETTLQLAHRRLADQDWIRVCLADLQPMRFGQRLWVCPTGHSPPVADGVVVSLDPGLAFGTGTHPTTALCLEWLDRMQPAGKTLIDYGCGSGILAIAALRLAARRVWATDIDPQALLASRDNARKNRVGDRLEVLTDGQPLPRVDLLMANILAAPLMALAPRFQSLVVPGGRVILAGLLSRQQEAVTAAFTPWFHVKPDAVRDDWVCLEAIRRD